MVKVALHKYMSNPSGVPPADALVAVRVNDSEDPALNCCENSSRILVGQGNSAGQIAGDPRAHVSGGAAENRRRFSVNRSHAICGYRPYHCNTYYVSQRAFELAGKARAGRRRTAASKSLGDLKLQGPIPPTRKLA